MPNGLLYKYRSLDNWKFVIDIIVNSRLFAATFNSLNDPMEGRYYIFGDTVTKGFQKTLLESKLKNHICSLTQERCSTLLWSYYASGHQGVAFGVHVPNPHNDLKVREVVYDHSVSIGPESLQLMPDDLALEILTQKQSYWEHEKEVRVFAQDKFVPVQLEELVLGYNISREDRELITSLARKWHPEIKITKIDKDALDHPDAVPLS